MLARQDTITGLDLAKSVFHVAVLNCESEVVSSRKLRRKEVLDYFAERESTLVAMEACGTSHYWGRELIKLGHEVRLLPPKAVKAYLQGNKNDRNDAVAIAEAAYRPGLHPVPVKSERQQDQLGLHRCREGVKKERTRVRNMLRSMLSERGVIAPQGAKVMSVAEEVLAEDAAVFSEPMRRALTRRLSHLKRLDEELAELDAQLDEMVEQDEAMTRLTGMKGIGKVCASALACSVGDGKSFKNGRALAAWMGLTPGHHGSGGKNRNVGITKRGNAYLRKMYVHGARSVVRVCDKHKETDKLCAKAYQMLERGKSHNQVVVAVAAMMARISWAMLVSGQPYHAGGVARLPDTVKVVGA